MCCQRCLSLTSLCILVAYQAVSVTPIEQCDCLHKFLHLLILPILKMTYRERQGLLGARKDTTVLQVVYREVAT
jgi:hypothetical protein